ncbi:MAG TPA: hypothetical protein VFU30_01305 [Gaiellaceae bacterium]|nr:hypothetical protein [Gaiellaceae bacterium]
MSTLKNFRGGKGRRYWTLGATLVVLVVFGAVFVASSGAVLTDSPFEGADGNMVVDTAGHTDWCTDFPAPTTGTCAAPIPGLRTLTDVPSGQTDNAFTQGSKEDDPNVTVAQGSVPPNKNDLTRAYVATEKISNDTFLYLAWERQPNPLGSANIDFELDQNASQGDFTQPGNLTINRTEGDILITYDFGGSGTPDLGLLTWLTPGNGHSDSDCEANGQTLPCWGDRVDVNPGSNPAGESAVNSSTILEAFTGEMLDAGSFGEAKIDLTAVPGLFTNGTCKEFGSMFVKSRSSGSSIDAELKDFIAPVPFHLSNCASPSVATQTSVTTMNVGQTETVGDTATLTGGDNPTGDVSFQLYSDANCHTAVTGVNGTATLNGSGVATFAGASFTPTQAGTYYWGVSYPGDDNNNGVSACGGDNEEIVVNAADVSITKTADHTSPVNAGDQIGFTVEVKNTGAGDATGVTLDDSLPAGSGSGVTWTIDNGVGTPGNFVLSGAAGSQKLSLASSTLPAGADYTIHLVAQTSATECSVYDNTATLTTGNANNPDPAMAEESCNPADVSITKTADHTSPVNAGDQIGFTVEVQNTGAGDATGVTLDDPLPAGSGSGVTWTIDSSVGTPGQFVLSGAPGSQSLSLDSGTLPAGADYTIHLVAQTSATECSTYDNTATLTTGNANNPDPAEALEACNPPGIHIIKTADAAQVNAGEPIGFTLTVYNDGSGDATDVVLTDTLPLKAGLTWSIDSQGAGWNGTCAITAGVLSCGPVTVPAGTASDDPAFSVHITSPTTAATGGVCPGGSGVIPNTGDVSAGNGGSDESSASTCVAAPTIHIVKTADAAKVNVGSPIGFTLTVYNAGSGDAHGVKLSDPLPTNAGLSWSIASQGTGWGSSCSISAGVLSCGGANGVTVPAGTTQAASTFTVHITSPTTGATGGDCPTSGVVNNTGTVTTANDGSDHSSASTCVQALVDLSVTKAGSPATQTLGEGNITWTIVVTNNGPSADTGVTIADPMPAGNAFVSASSTQGSCTGGAILNCNIGTMAAGASVTITLITTPSSAGTQTNTVMVAGNRPETNTANNTATASVEVKGFTPPPVACIAVSKVTPKQLFVGRKTKLTIQVTKNKKAVKGIHVQIKGPKTNIRTAASNSKGVIKQTLKMKKAGILVFSPIASKKCNTKRVGVTGVFTPPVTG